MIKSAHIHVTQYAINLDIETTENWYSHIPNAICEHEYVTVLWNEVIQHRVSGQ